MENKSQNNKKPFLLILIILIIFSLIFLVIIIKKNYNKWTQDWLIGNNINTVKKIKEEEKITSFLWQYDVLKKHSINLVKAEMLKEKNLLENKLIVENLRKYKEVIISGCNEVINWKKSLLIYDSELYHPYVKAKEIVDKNEFNMITSLINWKCEDFINNEQELCNIYKNKDLVKLEKFNNNETQYEYYLFKSLIQENNQCNAIKDKWDCTKTYQEFLSIKNSKIENNDNLLTNDEITNWKVLNTIGKDKYLEKLNSQFLDKCWKILSIN